jgi:hypothetical protein
MAPTFRRRKRIATRELLYSLEKRHFQKIIMRSQWIQKRLAKSDGNNSLMHLARQGEITEEMHYVAAREEIEPEFVRSKWRAGAW